MVLRNSWKRRVALTQFCFNLAMMPVEKREAELSRMQATLEVDDAKFDEFRRSLIDPMVKHQQQMFPRMHNRVAADPWQSGPTLRAQPSATDSREAYPGTDRYAPCPCNSGEKYKFCCGAKRR